MKSALATFAAGCFWGIEAAFRQLDGVVRATVGYTGGTRDDPTYEDVCSGTTGHAEAVQIEYDPSRLSYRQLLELFWQIHDPTTPNRQGPDIGTQYRSAIFFHNPEQEVAGLGSRQAQQESGRFPHPIVTEISPASSFYEAEEYHQQYLEKRRIAHCPTT